MNDSMSSHVTLLNNIQASEHVKNFIIARSISAGETVSGLDTMNLEDAWRLHDDLHESFMELRASQCNDLVDVRPNFIDLKVKLAHTMLSSCSFCERHCNVDREAGIHGTCNVGIEPRVCSAFLHWGEEHPIVPSGAIFFAGCNFKCVFCQNWDISTDPLNGNPAPAKTIAKIADGLASEGAKNINYVGGDPTPNLHAILESLNYQEVPVAQLWNSNFYNTIAAVNLLLDVMDIWLPDLKYGNDDCAQLSDIEDYWSVLTRNLKHVHDEMVVNGLASLVIRHLVMPGHVECCSVPAMEWIAKELPAAMVNIMGQYRPEHLVLRAREKYKDIARRPTFEEIDRVRKQATELGITWRPVS
ncbi:MAG TPA: radical SAM protein [Candidatus Lokiarchaeia archaeon]|nr:radical SAM protein [Candidatus Lokiarchaeia archaeon]